MAAGHVSELGVGEALDRHLERLDKRVSELEERLTGLDALVSAQGGQLTLPATTQPKKRGRPRKQPIEPINNTVVETPAPVVEVGAEARARLSADGLVPVAPFVAETIAKAVELDVFGDPVVPAPPPEPPFDFIAACGEFVHQTKGGAMLLRRVLDELGSATARDVPDAERRNPIARMKALAEEAL